VNCAKAKCIALTFDDGPVPQTAHLLDVLKHRNAHATFFVLGELAATRPALLRRMVREGHAIGDHSWDHSQFWHQDARAIRREVRRTAAAIKRATGSRPTLLRPPFGETNAVVRRVARQEGMAIVLWSVDPLDWRDRNTNAVIRRITKRARPGAIVLSHDIRPTTRRAIPEVIDRLQARGYVFVTVPELFRGRLHAGSSYSQR
jgi:peptidoglycan/xylan/chitin deacetylase (PgdA/CDA1 family)